MNIKTLFIVAVLFLTTLSSQSQNRAGFRIPTNKKSVPQLVTASFIKKYPEVLVHGWFATHANYWVNDYSSAWYSDWYGQRNIEVYSFEKPTYYEVEFTDNPGEISRSLYNLYGQWYETRTQIKVLPASITEVLKQSDYSTWKIASLKERIELEGWPITIYRFNVNKGMRSAIIRMNDAGEILQVKTLDDED